MGGRGSSSGNSGSLEIDNKENQTPETQRNINRLNDTIESYKGSIERNKNDLVEANDKGDKVGATVAQSNILALNNQIGDLENQKSNLIRLSNRIANLKRQL